MKPDPQYQEPRSAVIFRHTTDAVRNSHHTDSSLAQAIAERYMADVAPAERIVSFHETHAGTDALGVERAIKANAQLIARIRNGTVKMPVDLEESWVHALPTQWADACAQELTRRYGFIAARAPKLDPHAGVMCVAGLSVEFGQAIAALTNILSDGVVCAADLPELRKARVEMDQMLGQWKSLSSYVDGHIERLSKPRAVVEGDAA